MMPQAREGEWISVISEEQHEEILHTWANLVPLSNKANAEKGTKSWSEVQDHLKTETVFTSTKKVITEYSDWTPVQIAKRAELLSKWAIKRWQK